MEQIQLTPFETPEPIRIILVLDPNAARELRDKQGYTPVECSFGNETVVDDLQLDHHGPLHGQEGVAVRAYQNHFGKRSGRPRFVVTGFPDEDACFAIASLAGVIPHPSLSGRFPDAPAEAQRIAQQNLLPLARLVSSIDTNPDQAIALVDTYWGRVALSWRRRAHPVCRDQLAWYGGVDRSGDVQQLRGVPGHLSLFRPCRSGERTILRQDGN